MDKMISKNTKVDMICTDIPYGTTACEWDSVLPLNDMWERINQLVRDDNTPILLFGAEPFSSVLICSNIKNFKFKWYYKKRIASNFASAKYQPMKHIEDICVFTKNGKKANYYPILQERAEGGKKRLETPFLTDGRPDYGYMNGMKHNNSEVEYNKELKFPENIQEFNNREKGARGLHPTQKPISLMEYLIKSHTVENDIVLDFTMGSGTTGIACMNLGRKFIGIELDEKYFQIAKERIEQIER
jgi:site-specific DNA-methyltransferase (adenine-specific)